MKKSSNTRPQRGTPSPGSLTQPIGTNNRISPRRTTTTSSSSRQAMNTMTSANTLTHRRGGRSRNINLFLFLMILFVVADLFRLEIQELDK